MRIEKEDSKIRNPKFQGPMLFSQNPTKGGTPGHDPNIPEMSTPYSIRDPL
jgi:hypothetical protein